MIKYIVIEIDGKELKLSPDKAEKLYDELHKLYGQKSIQFGPYIPPTEPYRHPWTPDGPHIPWGPNSTYTDNGVYSISIN